MLVKTATDDGGEQRPTYERRVHPFTFTLYTGGLNTRWVARQVPACPLWFPNDASLFPFQAVVRLFLPFSLLKLPHPHLCPKSRWGAEIV